MLRSVRSTDLAYLPATLNSFHCPFSSAVVPDKLQKVILYGPLVPSRFWRASRFSSVHVSILELFVGRLMGILITAFVRTEMLVRLLLSLNNESFLEHFSQQKRSLTEELDVLCSALKKKMSFTYL